MTFRWSLIKVLLRVGAQLLFSICVACLVNKIVLRNYKSQLKKIKLHKLNTHLRLEPQVYPTDTNKISQHQWIYLRMERLIQCMSTDIVVKNRFIISKCCFARSVFLDIELLEWLHKNTDVESEGEARHLANLLVSYGYILPVHDRFLPVQRNRSFYRFQTPEFYPSNNFEPKDEGYAVHLCVRVLNSSKLDYYEKENLSILKRKFTDHWDEISRCAEYRNSVLNDMGYIDGNLLRFQERGFWNVHRPKPDTIHSTEIDYKKLKRYRNQNSAEHDANDDMRRESISEPVNLIRRNISQSHPGNNHIPYCMQYADYDPFIKEPEFQNYWLVNKIGTWKDSNDEQIVSSRRTKRWAFSLRDLLSDPAGHEHFKMFLEKEFSYENLKFWDAVVEFQKLPLSQIAQATRDIWTEYIESDGINIDSHSREVTRQNMVEPNRYTFDVAANHVYHLMETDSYQRYLKSKMYKDKIEESNAASRVSVWDMILYYTS